MWGNYKYKQKWEYRLNMKERDLMCKNISMDMEEGFDMYTKCKNYYIERWKERYNLHININTINVLFT